MEIQKIQKQNNDVMAKVKEDTFLGGLISDSCNNDKKLAKATNKGIGIISVIMAMLQEISFGSHLFEIASILRESLFINGILWNIETWYDVKAKDITELEKIDKLLMKRILNVPASTPSALLYLELGLIPLQYTIQARRLMFLWYILTRQEDDLLLKFFNAQMNEPCKNDWVLTVQSDLDFLELDYNFKEIKCFKKRKWLKIVKEACNEKAFDDILDEKMNYEKEVKYNIIIL